MTEPAQRAGVWRVLGVAVFLASSWTWVIGMWLPVLLMSDFGWAAWFAFAIPNVIGAASVGFLWTREKSKRFIRERAGVLVLFSGVTFAFQLAGIVMIASAAMRMGNGLIVTIGGWLVVVAVVAICSSSIRIALGAVVWLLSLVAVALHFSAPGLELDVLTDQAAVTAIADPIGLLFVVPAIVTGFLICPHLDLTLQSARRSLPDNRGAVVFALGYGGFFLVMIVGTLAYGVDLLRGGAFSWALIAHIALQSAFTAGIHLGAMLQRAAYRQDSERKPRSRKTADRLGAGLACAIVSGGLVLGTHELIARLLPEGGLGGFTSARREIYELFISAYGLVFPAFALIVMGWPRRGPALPVTKARLGIWLGTMAIAGPMMGVGYLGREYEWVSVAIAVVLLGAWIARKATRTDGQKEHAETAPEAA